MINNIKELTGNNLSRFFCDSRFIATLCFFLLFATHVFANPALTGAAQNTNQSTTIKFSIDEEIWLAQHPEISIAFDANYPPYSYKNEQGQIVGIAVDIANKLAKKAGFKLKVHPNGQWKNLYTAAQMGNVDVIATIVKQGDREHWFEFTRPYLSLSQYIITRKENIAQYSSVDSLATKTVALIEGYSTTELLLSEAPNIVPYYVDSLSSALEAVSTGQADAAIGDIGTANHLITTAGLSDLRFTALYTKELSKQRFGVRKDWPELATILDKSLEAISYQELMNIYVHWRVPEIVRPEAGFISVQSELTLDEKRWLKEHPVIRLASDAAWPPFESIDNNGRYTGIAAEYMALIEQRLGIKFVHSPVAPWVDIVEKLKNKELDVFSCAMETQARKAFAKFTEPYISRPMVIVTKNNVGFVDGLNGLYGRTIAVEKNYASYELLKQNHPELKLQTHDDSLSALLSISSGQAFAYVGNIASTSYIMRDKGLTDLKVSGQIPYQFSLSMGVRDDWHEFVPILQKALDSISLEDKNTILKKWIDIEVEHVFDYRTLWQIAALIVFVFIFIIYWNYALNRRIKKRTSELYFQANYDSLTKLPNRTMSFNTLARLINEARDSQTIVAVLLLDLDGFKKINVALGHHVGDELLIEVAKRLNIALHPIDLLGRLGGDEFIACLGGLKSSKDAVTVIETILDCFSLPFKLDGRDLKLTASIGISSSPDDGEGISELMRSADTAMYHAKSHGRNTYSYFDASMKEEIARRILLEECMHDALQRGEFEVHYQPKIEISSRKIMGFEALLRWNCKKLGTILPEEFISVAENSGLIIPLGKFVLKQALQQLSLWQSEKDRKLNMAINLSPVQFREESFVDYTAKAISDAGIATEQVEFEITEGVLMDGYSGITQSLIRLKKSGILLAMDDFGTGYSSLSYVRNYPFDILKIDREFICNITTDDSDKKLAEATIAMAKSLGLKVVAEGVETEEQLTILSGFGCDYAQGNLFGEPVSADEVTNYLKTM